MYIHAQEVLRNKLKEKESAKDCFGFGTCYMYFDICGSFNFFLLHSGFLGVRWACMSHAPT